jgi:hypothetical protein
MASVRGKVAGSIIIGLILVILTRNRSGFNETVSRSG